MRSKPASTSSSSWASIRTRCRARCRRTSGSTPTCTSRSTSNRPVMPAPGFLQVEGVRLEARWAGPPPEEAPTLVFLHEGLGSTSLWRDFPDRLAAETGCGALIYSRAGYGKSDPVPLPRPVRFMHDEAEALSEVLAQRKIRECILVGHSDGASIAMIYAGSRPAAGLKGLILEAPHVFTEPHGLA